MSVADDGAVRQGLQFTGSECRKDPGADRLFAVDRERNLRAVHLRGIRHFCHVIGRAEFGFNLVGEPPEKLRVLCVEFGVERPLERRPRRVFENLNGAPWPFGGNRFE